MRDNLMIYIIVLASVLLVLFISVPAVIKMHKEGKLADKWCEEQGFVGIGSPHHCSLLVCKTNLAGVKTCSNTLLEIPYEVSP